MDLLQVTYVVSRLCLSPRDCTRVPTSLATQNSKYFPGYFQVNAMKSEVNLPSNQFLC